MTGTTVGDRPAETAGGITEASRILARQKAAQLAGGPPSASVRQDRLRRAAILLSGSREQIVAALNEDYGHRSSHQMLFTDPMPSAAALRHAHAHVKDWMKPARRRSLFPLGWLGARSSVQYQPRGSVGIISHGTSRSR
jgi:coniferyl-aldehyde dehydrogenase